ncbi:hypothetical protein BJX99DRAFT_223571 [Aspergillus californicus]
MSATSSSRTDPFSNTPQTQRHGKPSSQQTPATCKSQQARPSESDRPTEPFGGLTTGCSQSELGLQSSGPGMASSGNGKPPRIPFGPWDKALGGNGRRGTQILERRTLFSCRMKFTNLLKMGRSRGIRVRISGYSLTTMQRMPVLRLMIKASL